MTLSGFYHSPKAAIQAAENHRVPVKVMAHSRAVWYSTISLDDWRARLCNDAARYTDDSATYELVVRA